MTMTRPTPGRIAALTLLAALALAAAGCSKSVTLTRVAPDAQVQKQSRTALNSPEISQAAQLFLSERDLLARWKTEPQAVVAELMRESPAWTENHSFLRLSELCFHLGKKARGEEAAKLHLSASVCAYQALFGKIRLGPYDLAFREASDFYNRALAGFVVSHRDSGGLLTAGGQLPLVYGSLAVSDTSTFRLPDDKLEHVYVSWEFAVSGLRREESSTGLGAPLVTVGKRVKRPVLPEELGPAPKNPRVHAATLTLTLSPPVVSGPDLTFPAEFTLHDPLEKPTFRANGRDVPLEIDFSTPLAVALKNSPDVGALRTLTDPDALKPLHGLTLLHSYQRGKIPVVMVHGLMSSPLTWAALINRLMSDPLLRDSCQFWFFGYSTGNPVLDSAASLREALLAARRHLDPDQTDEAFMKMVLVGHSMGGLLARSMAIRGDSGIWAQISPIPLDQMRFTPEVRAMVERMIVFEPVPYVSRLVFMATPHRGAEMADGLIGWAGGKLITLPFRLMQTSVALMVEMTKALGGKAVMVGGKVYTSMPTGIDGLSPKKPALAFGAERTEKLLIPFHSIIGDERAAGHVGGSDGVVPYWSSHLAGAQSEKVILSGHSVQEHDPAIAEVRRILHEHVRQAGAR